MLVYLPFWASWARALGWVFGQKRVRSGDQTTYKASRSARGAGYELDWRRL